MPWRGDKSALSAETARTHAYTRHSASLIQNITKSAPAKSVNQTSVLTANCEPPRAIPFIYSPFDGRGRARKRGREIQRLCCSN